MQFLEYKIQCAIFDHHKTAFPHVKFVFIPNASTDAKTGYFNKAMGLCPGAHDIHLFWDRFDRAENKGQLHVGIFEVKSPDGRMSSAQNRYASEMGYIGAHTGFGSSVRAYHQTLCSWGLKPLHNGIKEPDLRSPEQKKKDAFDLYKPR